VVFYTRIVLTDLKYNLLTARVSQQIEACQLECSTCCVVLCRARSPHSNLSE